MMPKRGQMLGQWEKQGHRDCTL